MRDEFIEQFVDDSQKAVYNSILEKLSSIVDAPVNWQKRRDAGIEDNYPFFPYDDYDYLCRIDERGGIRTEPVEQMEKSQKGLCHINCIRINKQSECLDIFTGFAYSDVIKRWVRHSWLYDPIKTITLETTGNIFTHYYGYRVDKSEVDEFDKMFNNELILKTDGSKTFDLRYLGDS